LTRRWSGDLTTLDFRIAFVSVGLVCLVSVLFFWGTDPTAGAEVSGHRRRAAVPPIEPSNA
jgi:hypothetical protein